MQKGLLSGLVVIGLLPAVWGRAAPLRAQAAALFTVTVSSAYLRAAPDLAAARTYSVFQGGTYAVTGRTADSAWVSLAYTAANKGTWIPVSYGDVAGRLADVPVLGAAAVAPAPTSLPGAPRVTPTPGPTPLADSVPAAAPAGPVRQQLTLTVNSTYVRAAPSWSATRLASLFRPAVLGVTGRDRFGNWLQITSSPPGWVPAGVGSLSGQLMELPLAGAPAAPAVAVPIGEPPAELPAWIPTITQRMRDLYALAGLRGRDPRVFAVAGDCNSERYLYGDLIYNGWYGYSGNEYLHPTWLYFGASMRRASLAVDGGFTSASLRDPIWANPQQCEPGESPFTCELRVSKASIVFIQVGTGDHFTWRAFEDSYRRLIETAIASNVLPVVLTKADNLEHEEGGAESHYVNNVIRQLAAEYEVPLLDFELATRSMENRGLLDEPGHDFHLSAEAIGVHVLATMQTLFAIRGR